MAPTIASQLTMSVIGLASKAFTRFATKRYEVRGAPILLEALKEPGPAAPSGSAWPVVGSPSRKGKEKAVDGLHPDAEDGGVPIRRGIVTGMSVGMLRGQSLTMA